MELDDLKLAWQALDRRLERQHALELHTYRLGRLRSVRNGLWPLATGQMVQLFAGVGLIALAAPFWIAHWGTVHLVVYGLALHAYGLLLAIFAGRDLASIARIDYAAPVLEIQARLAGLRAQRIRVAPWFAVTGCFVWVPAVLAVFAWLGADVWVHKPSVVAWFLASGCVALGITAGIAGWLRVPGRERIARAFDDSAAGRSVTRAQAVMEEIARFERE
jgi:hypothetical protein